MTLPLELCLLICAAVAAGSAIRPARCEPAKPAPRSHVRVLAPTIAEQVEAIPVLYDGVELGWTRETNR